jgi:hypothetical protein
LVWKIGDQQVTAAVLLGFGLGLTAHLPGTGISKTYSFAALSSRRESRNYMERDLNSLRNQDTQLRLRKPASFPIQETESGNINGGPRLNICWVLQSFAAGSPLG